MSASMMVAPLREVARSSLPALTNIFSPSKNPCVVGVTPLKGMKRFRYDPYRASVIVPSVFSPAKAMSPAAASFVASVPAPAAPIAPMVEAAPYVHHFAPYPLIPAGFVAPMAPPAVVPPHVLYPVAAPCDASPVPSAGSSRAVSPVPAAVRTSSPPNATKTAAAASKPVHAQVVAEKHYAVVKFKHDTYPYEAPFPLAIGDQVIVEGDRGESIGTVKEYTTVKPSRPVASRVVRKATQKDKDTLALLRRKEQAATKFCDNAVKEIGLNMSIVDTEYQFDQNKLSIYFKSKGMVDFRRLQRVLFREFRCRVWLVNWNELVLDE